MAGGVVHNSMAARIGKSSVSTPFDQAWTLIKRQTTLGEHKGFDDAAFSPYGSVTHFHGTTNRAAHGEGGNIDAQGLNVKRPYLATVKPNYGSGVYAHTTANREAAEKYARGRANMISSAPVLYGIRGTGLETRMNTENLRPLKEGETEEHYPVYFPEDIPRERIVEMEMSE